MNLSRKWLNEFVEINAGDREFAEAMTLSGSKVELTHDMGEEISNVVVGRILSMERHENSDHLWPSTSPPCPGARRSKRASCGGCCPMACCAP